MRKTSITLAAFEVLRSMKMAKALLVLAPLRVIYTSWPNEVRKWQDFEHLSVGLLHGKNKDAVLKEAHDVYLCNYEGLPWLLEQMAGMKMLPFDVLVADECFVTGTMVTTPAGAQAIETLKVGDFVLTSAGPQKVLKLSARKAQTAVKLKLSSGAEITCTEEHPFFTDKGWLCAKDTENANLYGTADLSNLQDRVLRAPEQNSLWYWESMLLEVLRSEEKVSRQPKLQRNYCHRILKGTCWQAIVEQGQSLVYRGAQKVVGLWEDAKSRVYAATRGERHWFDKARGAAGDGTASTVYLELPNSIGPKARRLSYKLQSRLWEPRSKASDRGGWRHAQQPSGKDQRPEKNYKIGRTWVDSVTHFKPTGGLDVWNLEVENTPNYFANGYLVHNCTKLKNSGGKRFRLLKPWLKHFKRRYILTGTPMANGLLDVFGQAYVMDSGATFGPYITRFREEFFYPSGFGGYDWRPKQGTEDAIHARLAPRCFYAHDEDWLQLPALIEKDIEVELPPKAKAIYDQMENALRLEFQSGKVTAANTGVASMKARQLANGGVYIDGQEEKWENVHDAKTEAVKDLIEELSGQPALVTYDFRHDLERLKAALGQDTPHIGRGGVSPAKLPELIASWNRGEVPVIIVSAQSMAHGVDGLQQAGRAVIWHSLTYNYDDYYQLIRRLQRSGQEERVLVAHIIAKDTIDRAILAAVRAKDKGQRSMFAALKNYWAE